MNKWLLLGIGAIIMSGFFIVRKMSGTGIQFLTTREGFEPTVYKDEAGLDTIGYGHLIQTGEIFNEPLTEAQAQQLLRSDLAKYEKAVNDFVTVPLNQNQFDALVSFVYNIGIGGFQRSTTLRKLNEGDYQGAMMAMAMWNKITNPNTGEKVVSQGLAKRRAREQELFIS